MKTQRAIILFGHGARDERWKEPFLKLQELIAQNSNVRVELSFLELMSPSLPDVIDQLVTDGFKTVEVIPVFFWPRRPHQERFSSHLRCLP